MCLKNQIIYGDFTTQISTTKKIKRSIKQLWYKWLGDLSNVLKPEAF